MGAGCEYQSGVNAGLQCFPEMAPQLLTNPGWLHGNDGSDLSLHLGIANAVDLSTMIETPTFDRHVPAVHVSCRAADTTVFVEQSSEQPVVRSWISSEEMTLAGELCTDYCTAAMATELSTQELCDFNTPPMAPELSMKMLD